LKGFTGTVLISIRLWRNLAFQLLDKVIGLLKSCRICRSRKRLCSVSEVALSFRWVNLQFLVDSAKRS